MREVKEGCVAWINTVKDVSRLIPESKKKYDCSLCKNDKNFKINFISSMNCTSSYATFDLGRVYNARFCPECGRRLYF